MEKKDIDIDKLFKRMLELLRPEGSFYIIAIIYGLGVGILTLAIPISVQSLVNTVTFGVLNQPLVIITIVLFALLIFSGVLFALETYVVELFQRHFYARVSADISTKVLNANYNFTTKINGVELVNRYFDIVTIQKSMASLLIGGISIVLETVFGLLLLAFYHPYFLVFDVILVFLIWLVWYFYGKKAMTSAVYESKAKYKTASWIEEMAKHNLFFKNRARKNMAIKTADGHIMNYLKYRRQHFKSVFSQIILLLVIYAVMSSLLLGLGGYLVMRGQLTLGQLVAAELVVTVILAGFSKSGKYLDTFYDLFAASDKINNLYDIQEISNYSKPVLTPTKFDIEMRDLKEKYDNYEFHFDYTFKQGEKYLITSDFYSSKLVFLDLVQGLIHPKSGILMFGENAYDDYNIFDLKEHITVINEPNIIEGTIEENLTYGRKVSLSQINDALEIVDLDHIDHTFKDSYKTKIQTSGYPLWPSQHIRVEIARAILQEPKVLIITEVFDQLETSRRQKILDHLVNMGITLIVFSNQPDCKEKIDKHIILDKTGMREA